jgi:hypothetical protein
MLALSLSCVPPARQLKREWSLWREFGCTPHRSMRSFKGIVYVDISEFESYMPSPAVRSLWGSCPGCRIVCQRGTLSEDCGDCNATTHRHGCIDVYNTCSDRNVS